MSTEVTVDELKAKMAEYYGKFRDAEIADALARYESKMDRPWDAVLEIHTDLDKYDTGCDVCRCLMELKRTK